MEAERRQPYRIPTPTHAIDLIQHEEDEESGLARLGFLTARGGREGRAGRPRVMTTTTTPFFRSPLLPSLLWLAGVAAFCSRGGLWRPCRRLRA
jgi:hypothetical protein